VNLTDQDVEEILKLLERSPYNELKLQTDRFTLELRPETGARAPVRDANSADEIPVDIVKPDKLPMVDAAAGEIVDVRPPLPGTFYRAPSPGAEPFTEVGQTVDADTILGLVETMKLMNSVVSGCHGEVVEICADNAQLVEAHDVLMRIRVAGGG
jgi:acetyl-CoA carboxylase biotin carboxyl carrier protein